MFDSGLGGLSVVRQAQESLPQESILYVADQAHVPYGGRDLEQIRAFATGISRALVEKGCKAIVMACNISTATALSEVQRTFPHLPILGVIGPGACIAAQQSRNGRIGVLATVGTVKSGAYTAALHRLDRTLQAVEVSCPAFVPLVEEGKESSPAAEEAAREYLAPIIRMGADTVILGCTHYPFLLDTLRSITNDVLFIDPAQETLRQLKFALAEANSASSNLTPSYTLTTTGDLVVYPEKLKRFLPNPPADTKIAAAHWRDGELEFEE